MFFVLLEMTAFWKSSAVHLIANNLSLSDILFVPLVYLISLWDGRDGKATNGEVHLSGSKQF